MHKSCALRTYRTMNQINTQLFYAHIASKVYQYIAHDYICVRRPGWVFTHTRTREVQRTSHHYASSLFHFNTDTILLLFQWSFRVKLFLSASLFLSSRDEVRYRTDADADTLHDPTPTRREHVTRTLWSILWSLNNTNRVTKRPHHIITLFRNTCPN